MKIKLLKKVRNRYIFKWDGAKLLTYDRTDNKLDSFESIEEFILNVAYNYYGASALSERAFHNQQRELFKKFKNV